MAVNHGLVGFHRDVPHDHDAILMLMLVVLSPDSWIWPEPTLLEMASRDITYSSE